MLGHLWRRVLVTVAVLMVLLIGFSRVALAAHFVSDVIAGYVQGAAWLAAITAVFSAWNVMSGARAVRPNPGLEPIRPARSSPPRLRPEERSQP